jgi:hypothetical protein
LSRRQPGPPGQKAACRKGNLCLCGTWGPRKHTRSLPGKLPYSPVLVCGRGCKNKGAPQLGAPLQERPCPCANRHRRCCCRCCWLGSSQPVTERLGGKSARGPPSWEPPWGSPTPWLAPEATCASGTKGGATRATCVCVVLGVHANIHEVCLASCRTAPSLCVDGAAKTRGLHSWEPPPWLGMEAPQLGAPCRALPGLRKMPHHFRAGFGSCRQPTTKSTLKHPTSPSVTERLGGTTHPPHTQPLRQLRRG